MSGLTTRGDIRHCGDIRRDDSAANVRSPCSFDAFNRVGQTPGMENRVMELMDGGCPPFRIAENRMRSMIDCCSRSYTESYGFELGAPRP